MSQRYLIRLLAVRFLQDYFDDIQRCSHGVYMLSNLISLGRLSLVNPKAGARIMLDWPMTNSAMFEFALLQVILSGILSQAAGYLMSSPEEDQFSLLVTASPIGAVGFHILILSVVVLATFLVGQLLGGKGSFRETLILMVWLQFMMIACQIIQISVIVLVPFLSGFIALLTMFLFFWLYSHFVTVLHGFKSAIRVFVGTILVIIASSFAVTYFLVYFGS